MIPRLVPANLRLRARARPPVHWRVAIGRSSAAWLLYGLFAADLLWIALHLVHTFTPYLGDPHFSLEVDRGYAELFQYLKWLSLVGLLALLARKRRAPLYGFWSSLFLILLLDDALLMHETAGAWTADWLALPQIGRLAPIYLGELLFAALLGLLLLTAFLFAYQRSNPAARKFSLSLIVLMMALVVVGVLLDLVHEIPDQSWLRALLAVLEDGGEMLLASVAVWIVWRQARPAVAEMPERGLWAQTAVTALALFAFFLLLLGRVQSATPGLPGNDGYYHIKMGLLVRQYGLRPPPPQLPFTILRASDFYDHHLLYHVYLALFAAVDPAVDGGLALTQSAKVASVLLPTLAFLSLWWFLHRQRVPWAALWTLSLFAISDAFLYRMSMPRTQAAALLLLVWGLDWLLHRRYQWLLPLGFLFVWTYDGFLLLIVVAGAYVAATAVAERRLEWRALLYPLVGILLGLVINPYSPQNLSFIVNHVLPKLGNWATPVGNEWYPYDVWELLRRAGFSLGLFLLSIYLLARRGGRLEARVLTALLIVGGFGLMLLRARRFIEYFPPFVVILAAFSLAPVLRAWVRERPRRLTWLPAALALTLLALILFTIRGARLLMVDSEPPDKYAAASLWLKAYGGPDRQIFQLDWDDFPRLFFYDSDDAYTVGLDPTYLELQDPDLYRQWVQITRGEASQPGASIRSDFDADYVFSDIAHDAFLDQAADDPHLRRIYRDEYAVIFQVLPAER